MIRLLTEMEDETVTLETLSNVYEETTEILDSLTDEEEAIEYLEEVQEQCVQYGCWLHETDPAGFRLFQKRTGGCFFCQILRAASDLESAYPEYDHQTNIDALRYACLRYMSLWNGNILSRDIGRIRTYEDLRCAEMDGYRLVGDACIMESGSRNSRSVYHAAWLSPDGTKLMMTSRQREGHKFNTYIYPFGYQDARVTNT